MKWFLWILISIPTIIATEIRGASLFGLETALGNTDCSWQHNASFYMEELARRNFNWLRIPFSADYVVAGNFSIMDEMILQASLLNMSVLLDWHRNTNVYQDDWLEHTSLEEYLRLYSVLMDRYEKNSAVKMIGLFNEYKGSNDTYWKEQMGFVLNVFETRYPVRFYWLVGCPEWSSVCGGMDWSGLPYASRVFVDHHKYAFQPITMDDKDRWETTFYHDTRQSIIGEWGYRYPEDRDWAEKFVDYLKDKQIQNSFFWCAVTDSGDTGGLWKQCEVFEEEKMKLIQFLWEDIVIV